MVCYEDMNDDLHGHWDNTGLVVFSAWRFVVCTALHSDGRDGLGRIVHAIWEWVTQALKHLNIRAIYGSIRVMSIHYEVALYNRSVIFSNHVLRIFTLLPVQRARCPRARTGTFFDASTVQPLAFDRKQRAFISRE